MLISGRFHEWLTTQCHEKYHVCLLSVTSIYISFTSCGSSLSSAETGMESRRKVFKSLRWRERLNAFLPLNFWQLPLECTRARTYKCSVVEIRTVGLFNTKWCTDTRCTSALFFSTLVGWSCNLFKMSPCPIWVLSLAIKADFPKT